MTTFVIGVVCSGNTCRSPVTAAWLRDSLQAKQAGLVWSAGLLLDEEKRVHSEPLEVAVEMGLSPAQLAGLRAHEARDIASESRSTDLLVWITDPQKVSESLGEGSRLTRMLFEAKRLNALLLPVMEADDAWEAKRRGEPAHVVLALYRQQAESLRRWAELFARLVP